MSAKHSTTMGRKLLIIDVAALGHDLLRRRVGDRFSDLQVRATQSVLPAVTCTVQASFRTASLPASHGMIANGLYYRYLNRPMFWEQSSYLVQGPRIWENFRRAGGTVGMMFWQQSMGEQVDLLLTPAPIHKHHGGMIQDCYAQPHGLYETLCRRVGSRFKLHQYWGPLASAKVGDWIAKAGAAVLADRELAPDLLMIYLPSLDYDLQRRGPGDDKCRIALDATLAQLNLLLQAARDNGYEVLAFGDYAIGPVTGQVVYPNRHLRQAGLLTVRPVGRMEYMDFYASKAFAVVDHEVAHVYVKDPSDVPKVAAKLRSLEGIDRVLTGDELAQAGLAHADSGEVVLVAKEGCWLAYPWWTDNRRRPDYATHVDIHNKPGYDPCELFFGWPPPSVSLDPRRIRGSHGRVKGRDVAYLTSLPLGGAGNLVDLAASVGQWLDEI